MADIDYQDLFWQVRAETPGVPLPVLFATYASVVRDFFSRSKAWQHSCPAALDLAAATDWPTLVAGTDIPTGTYVVEPVSVKWSDGTIIRFKTRDQLDKIDGDWEQSTASKPRYWSITGPGSFRVYPLLSANTTSSIYLRVALAPTLSRASSADAVPEYLANEFSEAWSRGTLAKLMQMPGKDWTNLQLASSYMSMFEQDIKMAKSRAAAEFGRPVRTVEYGGLPIGGSGASVSDDYGR